MMETLIVLGVALMIVAGWVLIFSTFFRMADDLRTIAKNTAKPLQTATFLGAAEPSAKFTCPHECVPGDPHPACATHNP